jgi:class 3 adenylate cyclase/AmiR/NasT family two-component response regulator
VADDNPTNRDIFTARLTAQGYDVVGAADGDEALRAVRDALPDLVLLDVIMPKLDGVAVCRELKQDPALPFTPVIMVTALDASKDIVAGLDAGADEYLTKPVDHAALVARVGSMLRIKSLQETVRQQAERLQAQADELAAWNHTLEIRVAEQVAAIERLSELQRFLSPQIAETIKSRPEALEPHRREITVCFCDLRGFTAFSESAEPEDLIQVVREYHAAMGEIIFKFEGTLEHFEGDGMMVFFNDPLPCDDSAGQAVRMAQAMRERAADLIAMWQRRGHRLGFGMGIAMGYATLGRIGFEGRFDYGAIGTVANVASRLCAEAAPNQILVTERIYAALGGRTRAELVGDMLLKGLSRPVTAFSIAAIP